MVRLSNPTMPPHLPVMLALLLLLDSRVVRSFHSPTQMSSFLVPKHPIPSQKASAASSTVSSTFAVSSTGVNTAFQRTSTSALQGIPERSDGGRGGGGDDIFSFLKDQLGDEFGTSINIVQGGSGGFGDGGSGPPPEAGGGAAGPDENDKASESLESLRSFDLKPREVVEYLDRFVIQQYDAKKVLAVAICDHYNHCRRCLEEDGFDSASKTNDLGYDDPFADAMEETRSEYAKPNVLLAGPTGVGKTYLLKNLAQLVGVPFVKADATKFSETGIVGRDAEDLVRDLVDAAGGNTTLASMGIIYVDEVDKIAGGGNDGGGTNRGGFNTKGVQNNFLKLLEDTDVSLERQGEMQFVLPAALGGSDAAKQSVNTRNILFIFSGAFSSLDKDIRKKREQKPFGIDLMAQLDEPISNTNRGNGMEDDEDINRPPGKGQSYLRYAETADFVRAGLEPEFVGRVPVRVALNALDASDLKQILIGAEGSVLKQFKRDFMGYNIRMDATDDALTAISELAEREGTGARGLVTILERTLREHKFELPSTSVTRFELDADTVRMPNRSLKQLLTSESAGDGAGIKLRDLKRWETKLNRKLPELVSAWLTDDAQTYLLRRSMSKKHEHQSAFSFAGQYFGTMLEKVILLIHDKTGQAAFPISLDVAMDPEVELRKWMSSLEGSSEDESDVVVDTTVLEDSKRDADPPRKKKVRSDK